MTDTGLNPSPRPRRKILLVGAVVLALAGALLWWAWRPAGENGAQLSGYIEGEALYLAAPVAGPVSAVFVTRGDRVAAGARLFELDAGQVSAQTEQRRAGIDQALAQVEGARAAYAQALDATAAARALAADARRVAERYAAMKRADPGTVSTQDLEHAQAVAASTAAEVRGAARSAENARAQIALAEGRVGEGRAALSDIGVRADQLAPRAPGAARVEEVFFQAGEWAGANQPVVSLLPDDRIKLRFFVPERQVARYRPGQEVRFSCDGCGPERRAKVDYVSPRAEFTPPVIYSRASRDRLVFLVEARPVGGAGLTPGLPVDVTALAEPAR